jgi:hypothetical protein
MPFPSYLHGQIDINNRIKAPLNFPLTVNITAHNSVPVISYTISCAFAPNCAVCYVKTTKLSCELLGRATATQCFLTDSVYCIVLCVT